MKRMKRSRSSKREDWDREKEEQSQWETGLDPENRHTDEAYSSDDMHISECRSGITERTSDDEGDMQSWPIIP